MPRTTEALFKVNSVTHPQSESAGVPPRSGRGMLQTQNVIIWYVYSFILPHPFSHFLLPFLWFSLQKSAVFSAF